MNYIYSFIIFEAGAFFGFFVAALLNAARAGQEITIKFEEEDLSLIHISAIRGTLFSAR